MIVPLSPYSPKRVNGYVQPLLDYLGLKARAAVLLRVSLSHGFTPEANNCHLNVWCQLRALGGGVQHGWHLVQDPRHKFSEAIFHTVWRSETGELRDLTPRQDGEKSIMFVPDNTRAIELSNYNGSPAINTFASVKVVAGEVIEPLQPIKLVVPSDFAQRHGLWPWQRSRLMASARQPSAKALSIEAHNMKAECDLSKLQARKSPYASKLKKPVTMRLSEDVVTYFKSMAVAFASGNCGWR